MIAYCLGQLWRFPHCVDVFSPTSYERQAEEHGLSRGHLHGHPGTRLQHGRLQLRLRLCARDHAGAHREGVVMGHNYTRVPRSGARVNGGAKHKGGIGKGSALRGQKRAAPGHRKNILKLLEFRQPP
jgi:hypothetical protein